MSLETFLNAGLFGVCAYLTIRFAGWLARDDDRRPYDWNEEDGDWYPEWDDEA